jgi:hypothetical protein
MFVSAAQRGLLQSYLEWKLNALPNPGIELGNAALKYIEMNKTSILAPILLATQPLGPLELPSRRE